MIDDFTKCNNNNLITLLVINIEAKSVMTWSPDLVTCSVTWHGAQPHSSIYKVMKSALTAITLRPTNYAQYQTYA